MDPSSGDRDHIRTGFVLLVGSWHLYPGQEAEFPDRERERSFFPALRRGDPGIALVGISGVHSVI